MWHVSLLDIQANSQAASTVMFRQDAKVMFTADPFVQQYGFPIKRYEANNKLPALVMSLYKPHCQTKELKQRYCKVTPAHCEGKERG